MSLNVVNQIISHLTSQGTFNHIFKGIQAFSLTENCLTCRFKVTNAEANSLNTLHGGFILGAVDFITSVDLMRLGYKKHVSVNLETSFINPGKLNSWIRSDSYILKKGKRLAFCEVKFVDERSGELVARGTHTKYIIEEK
uniref:Putative thioesterase superfamily member 2 n=1 Tax=Schistosoma japonicum TaxID=6182 RepID=C1LI05_SCHJA|nr:putative thioesterase superfamily member 2 [Schistosoma japonicum]